MSYEPPALFVAWRDPESRRIFPVGRLLRIVSPFLGYEFAYIQGARIAAEQGFQPFLAFTELGEVYRSRELLPFFKNRVLSPSRPDYGEYVDSLALDAASAEPMTLLAVSGGRRTTDLIEIFPDWLREQAGQRLRTRFLVRGVRHVAGAEPRILSLRAGERLYCMRDVQNSVNPQAIALRAEDHAVIGFLPDYLAADVSALLEHDPETEVVVERVNPPPVFRHHRVLCSLSARAPREAVGFRSDTFRPISPEATDVDDRVEAAPKLAVAGA
jgi:hypothetical protein